MKYRYVSVVILMILSLCLGACSSQSSGLLKSEANLKTVNVIVLMPVENKTKDVRVQKLLSVRILEELRFKGYPRVISDEKSVISAPKAGLIEPEKDELTLQKNVLGVQGADASMHCTLQESKSSTTFFYSPATVAVRCELRATKTGETIWNAQYRSTSRSFDVTNSTLKSNGSLESAIEDVVGKVMETLPYGPMLRG